MPGIDENSINIELREDILEISAEEKNRKYHKELLLPLKTKSDKIQRNYNNGILELRIKK